MSAEKFVPLSQPLREWDSGTRISGNWDSGDSRDKGDNRDTGTG